MASPGAGDHRITAAEAAALTRRHREDAGGKGPAAFTFGRAAFEAILLQEGCTGIRIYLGRGTDGAQTLVMVGTDAGGADLTGGEVMNRVMPCPPFCDPTSALAR